MFKLDRLAGTGMSMRIYIERIPAQWARRSTRRCTAPQCTAVPEWVLVDGDMPESHDAAAGELACCTPHITATYLNLRGAHVIAQRPSVVRRGDRRTRNHASTSMLSEDTPRNGTM
jgi:hypothetical protein